MIETPDPCELCEASPAFNLTKVLGMPTPTVCKDCMNKPNYLAQVQEKRALSRARIQAEADKAGLTFDQYLTRRDKVKKGKK